MDVNWWISEFHQNISLLLIYYSTYCIKNIVLLLHLPGCKGHLVKCQGSCIEVPSMWKTVVTPWLVFFALTGPVAFFLSMGDLLSFIVITTTTTLKGPTCPYVNHINPMNYTIHTILYIIRVWPPLQCFTKCINSYKGCSIQFLPTGWHLSVVLVMKLLPWPPVAGRLE